MIGNMREQARLGCESSEIREEMDQSQAVESAQAFSGAAQTDRGAQIANGKYPFGCWRASIAANAGIEQGTMEWRSENTGHAHISAAAAATRKNADNEP